MRAGGERPHPAAVSLRQTVARADGSGHRDRQAGKPRWGARQIRERLLRRLPHAITVPAASTVHAVLDRHGLVARARRSRLRRWRTAPPIGSWSRRRGEHTLQWAMRMEPSEPSRCFLSKHPPLWRETITGMDART